MGRILVKCVSFRPSSQLASTPHRASSCSSTSALWFRNPSIHAEAEAGAAAADRERLISRAASSTGRRCSSNSRRTAMPRSSSWTIPSRRAVWCRADSQLSQSPSFPRSRIALCAAMMRARMAAALSSSSEVQAPGSPMDARGIKPSRTRATIPASVWRTLP